MPSPRVERTVFAAGCTLYAAAVLLASAHPGPRAWGFHLPGFLSGVERFLVSAILVGGAVLLLADLSRGPAPGPGKGQRRERGRTQRKRRGGALRLPPWSLAFLLVPWGALLWGLRSRTLFMGDGTVWLDILRSSKPNPYSEPLAAWMWWLYCLVLRTVHVSVEAATAGTFSIVCGLAATALLWGIASEIAPKGSGRAVAFALLLTLGASQLYFGYIESYPPTAVLILFYLWSGMRMARGAGSPWITALALTLALAGHLAALYLVPSYLYLVWRQERPAVFRVGAVLLPFAATLALLILLGYRPAQWVGAFRIAARAAGPEQGPAVLAKPYAALSAAHAWDLLNAIALVLPIPALALLARGTGAGRRAMVEAPASRFLLIAAASALLLAVVLVLPVPPAQDWDLTSLFLIPLAVLAVAAACAPSAGLLAGRAGAAAAAMGIGALASFVLVNANEASGVRRFETLVGPGAKITDYGRAYGNELLATYYARRNDFAHALTFAMRARDAEPTNPRYWTKVGSALYELRRYPEAIAQFQESLRRQPSHEAYYNLGNALVRTGRYAEAAESFRHAIAGTDPRPDYYHNLGVALYRGGQPDSARALWEMVVRRWPDFGLSPRSLALHFGPGAVDSARAGAAP